MKIRKTTILFFLVAICLLKSNKTWSQTYVDFEDIMKNIHKVDEISALLILRNYQKSDPMHPLVYYEIGKRYGSKIKQLDPVTEYSEFTITAYNMNVYYGHALSKMDDKTLRKNRELLTDIHKYSGEKNPTLTDYTKTLKAQLDSFQIIINNGTATYNNFKDFVRLYKSCIGQFMSINDNYPNIKSLYLKANKQIINNLDNLSTTFDSTIISLHNYQKLSKEFQNVLHSPTYELIPISKYQMDGVTGQNYLSAKLQLWDYKTWVEEFKQMIDTEIKDLRSKIEEDDRKLDANIQYFSINDEYNDNMKYFKTREELRNLIKKFDYDPLPVDIFDYKMSKLNFLVNTRKQINNPSFNGAAISFSDRLNYYLNLTSEKIQLDEHLKMLTKSMTDENISKYYDYFSLAYKGKVGLFDYSNKELKNNDEVLNKSFLNLKTFVLQEEAKYRDSYKFVKHQGIDMPMFIQNFQLNTLSKGEYRTSIIEKVGFSNVYLVGGIYVSPDNKVKPYVMSVDSFKTAIWLSPNITTNSTNSVLVNSMPISIKPIDENNIVVLMHSWVTDSSRVVSANYILHLDKTGKVSNKMELDNTSFPTYFSYNDINEEFLIVYKGQYNQLNPEEIEDVSVALYDSTATNLWKLDFGLKGSFIDVVHTNNDFLLFFNFNQYQRTWSGNELVKMKEESAAANNVMSLYINHSGQVISNINYQSASPYFGVKAVKLNSNTVNLIAFQGNKPKYDYSSFIYNNKLNYMLTKPTGELIYSNFGTQQK